MTNKPNNRLKDYAKYSSLAFQMMSIIVIGTFAGLKIDQNTNFKFPLFTIILSLGSVFTAIYIGIKDFIKKK
jgi:F0F1-type ATP synthase assembly protein I